MKQSKWSVVIAALAGIAAGIASSVVMSERDRPGKTEHAAPQQQHNASREYVPILIPPSHDPVEEVRARSAPAPQPPQTQPRARPADEQQSLEEQKRATYARHDALVRAHREEPVDPAWAGKTSAMLKSDLAEVAQSSSFEVVETECKTTSCVATMKWATYGKAQAEWRKLLHHGYQANCSREITLPEPSDQSAPYQATLVLDCETWRAEAP
jgi:hypothetical protein